MIRTFFRAMLGSLLVLVFTLIPIGIAAAAPSDTYEADVTRYTNAERTTRSLVALRANSCLDGYAERLAVALVREQRLRHSNLATIMKACKLRTVGENVAAGYANGKAVTQGWMNSSGHRANILNRSFRGIGVGAAQDGARRWWAVQVFGS